MKRSTQFKKMLMSNELEFILEAHNGLSAKIVEEAGFKGIWGSGLSISAAMGVRDNNEASWTQVLEVLEFMADNTSIPILLDGDTGYGNFNNMRRLVKKLECRHIAAVCIEDKIFPKTNSFIKGESQPLADIDEFCGKIMAGKDAQRNDDFCIVARTESFISGWGLREALKRAEAYRQAGADAILVHSKIPEPTDVINFMKEWDNRLPIVIVPTMYFNTPTQTFQDLGISLVIWANHILRASIRAQKDMATHLFENQTLAHIEKDLPPVKEIFRLQGMAEYAVWEKSFLPQRKKGGKAVLLAASKGSNFGNLTDETPKAMLEVEGKPVINWTVKNLRKVGIRDINIVTGFKPEKFDTIDTITKFHNEDWETTGEVGSLLMARDKIQGRCMIGYGDVICRRYVVENLMRSKADLSVVVDYAKRDHSRKSVDYALVTPERVEGIKEVDYELKRVDPRLEPDGASGEWTGLLWCTEDGSRIIRETFDKLVDEGMDIVNWSIPELLTYLVECGHSVSVQFIHDDWLDIDDIQDLSDMYKFSAALH